MIKEIKDAVEKFFAPAQIVDEKTVNFQQRTVLLLDSRNELVTAYFDGASKVAKQFKSKAINNYEDYLYTTCKGFILAIRDLSIQVASPEKPLPFGVGDIIQNRKKQMRLIINLHRDKTGALQIRWIDPHSSRTPMQDCSLKTMVSWSEK